MCLYNPRSRAVDAHQEGEAVKSVIRYRNNRVPINNRKYIELAGNKDIVGVQVVVGKAKPLQPSVLCYLLWELKRRLRRVESVN